MKESILETVRHILTFGGAYLVQRGLADEATVNAAVGGVLAVIGIVWGIYENRRKTAEIKSLRVEAFGEK